MSIELVRFTSEDMNVAFNWRNDPQIYNWCRQVDVISRQEHNAWFASIHDNPKIKMYTIVSSQDSKPFGVCGLTDIDVVHRRAEFSLYVGPEHQKKGIGKMALLALLDKAFNDLNLNLIWGETVGTNAIAMDLFTKIGMVPEGTRRKFYFKNGLYVDSFLFSITAEEFNGKYR